MAGTTVAVSSIAGFTHQINSDGVLAEVSSSNPKRFYVNPTGPTSALASVNIIGAVGAARAGSTSEMRKA